MSRKLLVSILLAVPIIHSECGRNLTLLRDVNYPPKYLVDLFQPALDICHKNIKVDDQVITQFRDDEDYVGTKELGCYLFCIFREQGLWNSDKTDIDVQKMMELIPPEYEDDALKIGIKCMKVKGNDECSKSLWYHNCWKKNGPTFYYLM
ncbi:general odorant-binding protein 83a-like [Toxorhynchites rutilus septentrionalis]|uniref:general odorant-binding protein 83a-like n=1 Tax=Toxorhynchites rutilus septentrionalis TaxID=329112 RepID=UPI00247A3AF2|nr:general odorant-binding protein 83a-like [Toxorhynchites rutilus septentrionalis]